MNHKLLSLGIMILTTLPSALGLESAPPDSIEKPTVLKLGIEARVDFQYDRQENHTVNSETGFKGKYLMVRADGQIVKGLTYSWRQRFNVQHLDRSFFDATDWLYLNYEIAGLNFQAGKEIVAIGGFEYDRAPFDLYSCSVFWNNIPCYALGVSAAYDLSPSDRLTFQVTQSPFFTKANSNMYAYNLMWNGHHSFFDAIYSVNLIEYLRGHYISYIALGNKFTHRNVSLELDLMNRAASHQTFLFRDCSVMAELSWNPNSHWRVFGKMTYDVNKSGTDSDFTVFNGTELTMAGVGLEYFPLRKQRHTLRIHANAFYSWGKNTNTEDLMHHNTLFASAGLTWHIDLLNIRKK